MAVASRSGRCGRIPLALLLASALCGCGAEEVQEVPPPERAAPPDFSALPEVRVTGGGDAAATRRISEGCEPVEEAARYEGQVGQRTSAILQWTGISEAAAALRIPVFVVGIEEGAVLVRFLEFPAREEYLHVWLGSSHIEAGAGDVFRLDPCSARLEP